MPLAVAPPTRPPADDRLDRALTHALDRALERPRLDRRVETATGTTRWGSRQTIAHSPRSGVYLRLPGERGDLLAMMDGTRTLAELVAAGLDAGVDPAAVGGWSRSCAGPGSSTGRRSIPGPR